MLIGANRAVEQGATLAELARFGVQTSQARLLRAGQVGLVLVLLERVRRRVLLARRELAGGAHAKSSASEQRTLEGLLEGEPKLGRHELVQERVNGRAQVVHNAGNVGQLLVDIQQELVLIVDLDQVGGEQALGVEGDPADEEGYHDGHCGEIGDSNEVSFEQWMEIWRGCSR